MQDMERNYRDFVGKSSNTRSRAKARCTLQDRLLGSESSSSLKEVRFSEKEFPIGTTVFNIKFDHPRSQNDNLFYLFHNQLDYAPAHYFVESETTKSNIDKFLSNPLMALLIKKLFYQNADEQMKKLSEISWSIPNNKWIEHKFELQSGVAGIAGQKIVIYSQNVMGCFEFLMKHPGFGITKHLSYLVYVMKMRSQCKMKCIPAKGGGNAKKCTFLKSPLYLS